MAFVGTDFIFAFNKKDGALGLKLRLLDDQIVVIGVSGQLEEEVVRHAKRAYSEVVKTAQAAGVEMDTPRDKCDFLQSKVKRFPKIALPDPFPSSSEVLAVNGQQQFEAISQELRTAKELYFVIRRHAAACDLDLDAMRPAPSSEVPLHSTADDLPAPPWAATAEPASSSAVPAQSAAEGSLAPAWAAVAEAPTASSAVPADDLPAPPWAATAEAPATSSAAPAQSTSADFPASPLGQPSETDDPPSQQMLGWYQRAPGQWFHPSTQESFNEGDPNSGWTQYLDEGTSKPWFWHDATQRFFFWGGGCMKAGRPNAL
ncbi:hypothetical protein AK812_SmicGene31880 [Symbiodinium microadriaticum]|uniref:Uncharacterized protein n=1 Tax=Symbiodinium microadriaticum TaxID=2951 RepID=A0A1Q9CVJ9_SYMMI|nr:hypothetical protein AK812_SmicGene31880 [Symbiodinium microadriaticum]